MNILPAIKVIGDLYREGVIVALAGVIVVIVDRVIVPIKCARKIGDWASFLTFSYPPAVNIWATHH